MKLKLLLFFLLTLCLTGCETGKTVYAPVTDLNLIESLPKNGVHRVQPGETLYSIAWRYGLDYRYLVVRNNIHPPFHVLTGQVIYLKGNKKQNNKMNISRVEAPLSPIVVRNLPHEDNIKLKKPPIEKNPEINQQQLSSARISGNNPPKSNKAIINSIEPKYKSAHFEREDTQSKVKQWNWPARGAILGFFSNRNKGLNIGGKIGDPIYATAAGRVVYSGNGLRRYGNMIIIKHNSNYLTAYAHNNRNLVKEGDWIQSRQMIAEMGDTGTNRTMLHFEMRKDGKPVNPLKFIRK